MSKSDRLAKAEKREALMQQNTLALSQQYALEMEIYKRVKHEFDTLFAPFIEHREHLRSLLNTIDGLAVKLPMDDLYDVLWKMQAADTTTDGSIEKDLSGTWYTFLSLCERGGRDFRRDYPEVSLGIKNTLIALKMLFNDDLKVKKDGFDKLRAIAQQRPDLRAIMPIQLGRPTGGGQAQTILIEMARDEKRLNGCSWPKAGIRSKQKLFEMPDRNADYDAALQLITYDSDGLERDSASMGEYLRDLNRRF